MPRRKKTEPTEKQRKFAEGVAAGKTDKQAALDAGYKLSAALDTKRKIWSKAEVQEYFKRLMQKAAPPERIVKKISEHIDGKSVVTKIRRRIVPSSDPAKKGEETEETVIERVETIDAGISLRACELAIAGGQYMPRKNETLVGVGIVLEDELVRAGESWEPPEWALRLKAGA